MSLPLDAFHWMPPDAAAMALIPSLQDTPAAHPFEDLLGVLFDSARWCPPEHEQELVIDLLHALSALPGFPPGVRLGAVLYPGSPLAPTMSNADLTVAGGIGRDDHGFWICQRNAQAHGLTPITPRFPAPNGLFQALAIALAPHLPRLLHSEHPSGDGATRLRRAVVRQLGRDAVRCHRLLGIEMPNIEGLLPGNAERVRRRLDNPLMLRIQQAMPILWPLYRSRYGIEQALGLTRGILSSHLDREMHPIGTGCRPRPP
jgi:hypothetical protein